MTADEGQSGGVRGVVAGHGTFASGIISAVEQITGRGRHFVAISNTGLCLDDIQSALVRALDETGARVIFTDLPAGSCTMAVRRLIRERQACCSSPASTFRCCSTLPCRTTSIRSRPCGPLSIEGALPWSCTA